MSTNIQAWLLCIAPGEYAVLSRQAMGHLIKDFKISSVPQAPSYANHVYLWKQKILPIFNLSALLLGERTDPQLLAIVAYRRGAEIKQGALALFAAPLLVEIPEQAVDWPDTKVPWSALADSCVRLDGYGDCVILSTDKLFNYGANDLAQTKKPA